MASHKRYTVTLDDDPSVCRLIERSTALPTIAYPSANAFLEDLDRRDPVGVFIDIHLGHDNGLDIIQKVKAKWPCVPILVLTADKSDEVLIKALALGADDFILKPLNPPEILARLQARLGHAAELEHHRLVRLGNTVLDLEFHLVKTKASEKYLSPIATRLLSCLGKAQSTIVPPEVLKSAGWGELSVSAAALDRRVREIRVALEEVHSSLTIVNRYGKGFVLKEDVMNHLPQNKASVSNEKNLEPLFNETKIEALRRVGDGTNEFLGELSEIFLNEYPRDIARLETALKTQDWESVRRAAHKLEGMCANLGIRGLQEEFARINKHAHAKQYDSAIAEMKCAEATYREAEPVLRQWMKAA